MARATHHHRRRVVAMVPGAVCLVLALTAASLASSAGAEAQTRAVAGTRAAAAGGSWRTAIEVPGTAALNVGGHAQLTSVSCASAGNCSAGGYYWDASGNIQALVAREVNGVWRRAQEVPGTAALNKYGAAEVNTVSCASAGNCSAGGFFRGGSGHIQAFVAAEVNNVWRRAQKVPGTAVLNAGGDAEVTSLSCAGPGSCTAAGYYLDASARREAFVASEVNGVWKPAEVVPGIAALNKGGGVEVHSVSCAGAADCSLGGSYLDVAGLNQAFVARKVNGVWRRAQEVPGTAALNMGGFAQVLSVSCASAGNCSAGGYYADAAHNAQAFVAVEVNGVWRRAQEVPGTAALNIGGSAQVWSLSCPAAGDCSAGGTYIDASNHSQAFVVAEVNGSWRRAQEVPGTAALNAGGDAQVNSVSCAQPGDCSAGGFYAGATTASQAFVATQVNGVWGRAEQVPGTAALDKGGNAQVTSLSCATAVSCSAGGSYADASLRLQAFIVNKS